MKVGFTGTRHGMTTRQLEKVREQCSRTFELHHGDCVGADSQMHAIAQTIGCQIIIHPPSDTTRRAWCQGAYYIHKPRNHLARNHDIVDATDFLLAAPYEPEETLRSGTWATIRYARKSNKPIIVIAPNGTITNQGETSNAELGK
jgi:hypothetical protein